jgi:hypothetical protein
VIWLIMADAAFFDVYASPFSEPAALVGLLLVAAGAVHLGRDSRHMVHGLVLVGAGGFLAILAKEQYLILVVPICLTLVLASANRGRGPSRFRTRQVGAALAVAGVLVMLTALYIGWDSVNPRQARLHRDQAADMIFDDIITRHDPTMLADLRALGLPASWARYAGHDSFSRVNVWDSPLHHRYAGRLSDSNIAHFLLTHPGRIISVGQLAAKLALQVRNTREGNYAPSAGHPPGALESRVVILTWLMDELPASLGLLLLVPLWLTMAAIAIIALRRPGTRAWRRDGAVLVLCMTGCAVAAFLPPAYFAGISTTRHMVGMNLATALALPVAVALGGSLLRDAVTRRRRPGAGAAAAPPEPAEVPDRAASPSTGPM